MSDAPIKSYVLRGNLNDLKNGNCLVYDFVNSECRLGLWKICVLNVGYEILEETRVAGAVNQLVQISTNFVRDHRFNNSTIENYSPSLVDFLLKGTKSEKKLFTFDKTWFYVNCAGDQIKLYFLNSLNGNSLPLMNINIFITILLQKIK
jgi:hypothetical protein